MPLARLNRFISRRAPDVPDSPEEISESVSAGPISVKAASLPEGQRVYAIGDIHGRKDLLLSLLDKIAADQARRGMAETFLVFLGDYVDRGPESAQVVDVLLDLEDTLDMTVITLKGNHESAMLSFLQDPVGGRRWLHYGGDATLKSYGVDLSLDELTVESIRQAARSLKKNLPDSHLKFFGTLPGSYMAGDYFFVHAGIDPARMIDDQKEHDLLWIRDEFLEHDGLFEKVVVHGHSIIPEPEFKENRIGIDTGAFYSNVLTCLVLEGNAKEVL